MKQILLLLGSICCPVVLLLAQTDTSPGLRHADETLIRNEAKYIVNRFKTAVQRAVECPLFNTNGITGLFLDDAYIEVSTRKPGLMKRYLPAEYFEAINALVCGKHSQYDSVRISHFPVPPEMTKIIWSDDGCIVQCHIAQKFSALGTSPRKAGNYLEITFKTVVIHFNLNRNGVLEGKISRIIASTAEVDPPSIPLRE